MKKTIIIFFLIFISSFLFSEVIILENGERFIGKIIKIDEDTITILTKNDELVFDRDEIVSIFREEKDYNNYLKKRNQIDNLIKNGDFSNDYYWALWGAKATYSKECTKYSIVNGVAVIDIIENVNNSHIDFSQINLCFERRVEYIVKFKAKASIIKDFKVVIQQMGRDLIVYYEKEYSLTENMKEYEFTFKMKKKTDNNVGLLFVFKYEKSKIYINNVVIKKK